MLNFLGGNNNQNLLQGLKTLDNRELQLLGEHLEATFKKSP
jgi:hypothetical protein